MMAQADLVLERARARVGRVLCEKWRLDALLGVGGMAAVYAATHRNGARVAIKMLHTALSLDANVQGRFLREGYIANSVGHRGIVMVLDDNVTDDGSVFLVMELLEGETLECRRLRLGGVLDPADVLSITDQVLDVLVAAHAKGVVHRDLKPENVFVTVESVVKVLDFGIARVKQLSTASTATQVGTAMGTPSFMPPEQARGRWDEVDARSDLWAVGATAYTLLTGKLVHDAMTTNEQLLAAMTAHAPSLATQGTHAEPIVQLIDRALAHDKTHRWSDAASMQEAVRTAYHAVFRAPIGSAAKLTVPPSAHPPHAEDHAATVALERSVTTDGAVAKGHTGLSFGDARRARIGVREGVSAAVAAIVVGVVAALVFRGAAHNAPGIVSAHGERATVTASSYALVQPVPPPAASSSQASVDIETLPIASQSPRRVPAAVAPDAGPAKAPVDGGRPTGSTTGQVDFDKRK